MGIITSLQQIRRSVQEVFGLIDSGAIVLHTDLIRFRFVQRGIPLQLQRADLFQMIAEEAAGRTLLFPTFNYDFCQTRVYDILDDPCQVGALNEYVRQLYPDQRTLTPIFNFCICNNRAFSLGPVENPFSESSTFSELVRQGAAVVFFGASFSGVGAGAGYLIGNHQDKKAAAEHDYSTATPLSGTEWTLSDLTMENKPQYQSYTVKFTKDGKIVSTLIKPDGTKKIEEERYRIVDDTIVVHKTDYIINAKYALYGNELVITTDKFKAVLKKI